MKSRLFLAAILTLFAGVSLDLKYPVGAQNIDRVRENYTKYEYRIPMRDGARIFTVVYQPKDRSRTYPFLLTRTPYSVSPYGIDTYRATLGPSEEFEKEGFIFVYQDARGRFMSEGEFSQVRPHIPVKRGPQDVDESTDTYDTIAWLLENVSNHNGRVGMVGISQPGFHVAASLPNAHPALIAASPQAPTADYYMGDDVYHNGAFMMAANLGFYGFFKPRKGPPAPPTQLPPFNFGTPDGYDFFMGIGPLAEVNQKLFNGEAGYWQEIIDHPNYDEFWQKRSLWKFMEKISPAVLNVGGWFDAEDPMGPLHIFRSINSRSKDTVNLLVMGPWCHGCWSRGDGDKLGNVPFAVKTAAFFREKVQFPFFMHYLKDQPIEMPKAWMFLTGINEWRRHAEWPPADSTPRTFYLREDGKLGNSASDRSGSDVFDEYISDPRKPVPYLGYIAMGMTRDYMTEDQRFAAQRPDVLVYQSEALENDLTVAGPIKVDMVVSTTGTDSDFVVKVIDVYPGDFPSPAQPAGQQAPVNAVRLGGYQQLVRGEPFRTKFRNGFERPVAMTPGQPARITFEMPDIYHAFRRGHKIMIQIQSSWFPLIDRNPQKFIDIPRAQESDYQKATQRIYRSKNFPSSVILPIESKK